MTIAVVLAAGRGERLGGPKALLAWPVEGGELPLAAAHARARADCDRVLVVTRADLAERIAPYTSAELIVSHADDALGPAGSLAVAAQALGEVDDLVVVTPVDTPPASAATVARLVAAMAPEIRAARPQHGARRGHPVVLRGELLGRYRVAAPPLRELLRELGAEVIDVDVDDAMVLADLDTPEEVLPFVRAIRFF